jgi:hypothetical protein
MLAVSDQITVGLIHATGNTIDLLGAKLAQQKHKVVITAGTKRALTIDD